MTLDAILYLVDVYRPFVIGAAVIGLITGWWSVRRKGSAR